MTDSLFDILGRRILSGVVPADYVSPFEDTTAPQSVVHSGTYQDAFESALRKSVGSAENVEDGQRDQSTSPPLSRLGDGTAVLGVGEKLHCVWVQVRDQALKARTKRMRRIVRELELRRVRQQAEAVERARKKAQRIVREMVRNFFGTPSERYYVREQAQAIRRARILARKKARRPFLLSGRAAERAGGPGKSRRPSESARTRQVASIEEAFIPETIRERVRSKFSLVPEAFAREHCKLDAFEKRQLDVSDAARRGNDGLLAEYPYLTRHYLVQRTKAGHLRILSEHVTAVDESRRLVVVGPVSVAGRLNHEEVRAVRRIMLARAQIDSRLNEFDVIALTTGASREWRDNDVLVQMGYCEVSSLTREGIGWLPAVTQGADVRAYRHLGDAQLLDASRKTLTASEVRGLTMSAETTTRAQGVQGEQGRR